METMFGTTLVAIVLDESGSMSTIADDTRAALNAYVGELRRSTPQALVSLMAFDTTAKRMICNGVPPSEVPEITEANYKPNAGTPLYDAIGKAINETQRITADKYLVVILTDGYENSSREFTAAQVKTLIETMTAKGNWTFVYLGANQDAWAVGQTIGVATGSTMSYASTGPGVRSTMDSLASATHQHTVSGVGTTATFFEDAGQTTKDYEEKK